MEYKTFTDFLTEDWLPNLVGLIGGLLGAYTFIDSYLISFKPKIYIGSSIVAETIVQGNFTRLDSLICSLELCNHRKKYGVIYDFAVRIYNSDEINSDKAIYYASKLVERIPNNVQELQNQNFELFRPITVLPDSNNSVNFVMSEVLHRSKMLFDPTSSYFIEVYYQKKPNGRWYFINNLNLYNKGQFDDNSNNYILFSALNRDMTRDRLKTRVKQQKTSLYKAASEKVISNKIRIFTYKLIQYPYFRIRDILISIPFYAKFGLNRILDKFIKIPIIKRYGKSIDKPIVRFGSPESKPITEKAFDRIFSELEKLAKKINDGANEDAEISLKKDGGQILLSRNNLVIMIYKSGDRSIHVHEHNSSNGSRLRYNIALRSSIWNNEYWYLENYGFITIKSFAVKILDAFIIHSSY